MFTVNRNPSKQDLRRFGWAMLLGFGLLGLAVWIISWWRGGFPSLTGWAGKPVQMVCLLLWIFGLLSWPLAVLTPTWAKPVYVVWMTVSAAIGMVMTTVLLSVLFVLMLPVFSLIVRSGDPLRKRWKRDGSYWEDYPKHEPTLERMRRPF